MPYQIFRRPPAVPIRGAVVLITGAASGIGRLMALEVARRGAKAVIIWDLNEDAGVEVAEEVRAVVGAASTRGGLTSTASTSARSTVAASYAVDVTSSESVSTASAAVLQEFGRVDILINNAGVVTGKNFLELTDEDISRTFEVNTISHYRVTREFLPGMIERDRGSVVTIASAAGLVGVARQTDYSASKFGAVGFAESLRAELRHLGSNVHTLLYCPYYISTGMFEGVTTKFASLLPILTPEKVAIQIIDAIERGTQMKVAPPFVKLAQTTKGLPIPVGDAILDFFGINSTMDGFVGRTT